MAEAKAANTHHRHDEDEELPPYSALPSLDVLPSYLSACPLKPYLPFPDLLHACRRLTQLNAVDLCGGGAKGGSTLYHVETRRGVNKIEPLGSRAGVVLRNGPASRAQVLAAAGQESPWARYCRNPTGRSVYFLPPLEIGTNSRAMVMETMRMAQTVDGRPTWTFFVEVEPIREWKRQKFQWVQAPGRTDLLNLVRVLRSKSDEDGDCDVSGEADAGADADADADLEGVARGELVATLTLRHEVADRRRRTEFTLAMLGSLRQGRLGERCALATVVTALWIWRLQTCRRLTDGA